MEPVNETIDWYETTEGAYVPSQAYWSPSDPLAVRLVITNGDECKVEWLFGLNLLKEVAEERALTAGIGDVKVSLWWSKAPEDNWIILDLRSPFGRVQLKAGLLQVREFTKKCPVVEEVDYDYDGAMKKLLGGS